MPGRGLRESPFGLDGGIDALDTLAFRISGSGERVAEAFEAKGGDAPELVIEYA